METVVDAFERDAWDEAHAAFSAVRPALSSLRGRYVLDAHGRAALPTMGTDVAMHQFLRGGFDNEAREAVALADVALQFSVVGHGYNLFLPCAVGALRAPTRTWAKSLAKNTKM